MADFQNFGGSDEENVEIRKLNAEVVCRPLHERTDFWSIAC